MTYGLIRAHKLIYGQYLQDTFLYGPEKAQVLYEDRLSALMLPEIKTRIHGSPSTPSKLERVWTDSKITVRKGMSVGVSTIDLSKPFSLGGVVSLLSKREG